MEKEGKYPEKRIYKILLIVLKVIPMLLALSAMLNMFFDFLGLNSYIFSYIGGISVLPILFIYLASFAFRFCRYHRMFLHYTLVNNILTYIDYSFGIPISDYSLFMIHLFFIGLFLFLVLYFHRREKCCRR